VKKLALLLMGWAGLAHGATVWDENVSGDLSNDGLAPTLLSFATGDNDVHGTVGNPGTGVDRDYFTFTVLPGTTLTSITLLGDTNVSGGASFFAIQAGQQVTAAPTGAGADALLAYTHYGNDFVGQNLLQFLGLSALSPGNYAIWVQETGGPATYGLDFQVCPVPLPAGVWLLASGLLLLRRRVSSN
jgi:hypothetical protein